MSEHDQELDALAAYVRRRNLDPDDVCVLFAHAIGFTIAGGVASGVLTREEAAQVVEKLDSRIRNAAGIGSER